MDKTEKITVRFTENQKAKIIIRALEMNMKVAEYIRYLVIQDLEKNK